MEQDRHHDADNEIFDEDWDEPYEKDGQNLLMLNIDGWEGPLDVLLSMARTQKVDLRQISILDLVKQYLKFIDDARSLKLELAADYLVMAAWLTYLKSALLLPKNPDLQKDCVLKRPVNGNAAILILFKLMVR